MIDGLNPCCFGISYSVCKQEFGPVEVLILVVLGLVIVMKALLSLLLRVLILVVLGLVIVKTSKILH